MTIFASAFALILLMTSVPIFLVFGIGGSMIAVNELNLPWSTLLQVSFTAMTKQVLLAIPLFIFTGQIMLRSGGALKLVEFTISLVGHWRGGLGLAMVLTMGFFAAFCGSVLAAITAVGTILMPRMIEEGYSKPFVVVLAASAGLLEGLIPPSNAAILYSALTETPVSQTFAAGIFPGFILMGMLLVYVSIRCSHMKHKPRASWSARGKTFLYAIPSLFTAIIIMGGIYLGFFTPSESAAVAAVWALLVGALFYRKLTLAGIIKSLLETAAATTMIFSIIAMATFLSVVFTFTGFPQLLITLFIDNGTSSLSFLFMVGVICLILGTFLEVLPVFYLVIPTVFGAVFYFQVDPFHFYIVFVAFVGVGLLTPPVCIGIFTASAVINESPDRAMREVGYAVLLFILYGTLMIFWEWPSTWLPSLLI